MTYGRRGPAQGLVADTDHVIGDPIYLGGQYVKVLGFQARNWASSAKAAAGTDVAAKVKLTDANGVVFFLDAADRDYATATKYYFIELDDTVTGIFVAGVDATGAAVAAGQQIEGVIVASPVTVTLLNGATATDYFELYLFVERDPEATRK